MVTRHDVINWIKKESVTFWVHEMMMLRKIETFGAAVGKAIIHEG